MHNLAKAKRKQLSPQLLVRQNHALLERRQQVAFGDGVLGRQRLQIAECRRARHLRRYNDAMNEPLIIQPYAVLDLVALRFDRKQPNHM